MNFLTNTVSARDIQRDYRRIFNRAKKTKQPITVLTNNKPDVTIIDAQEYDYLQQRIDALELKDALEAVRDYHQAKKDDALIEADSLADLLDKQA